MKSDVHAETSLSVHINRMWGGSFMSGYVCAARALQLEKTTCRVTCVVWPMCRPIRSPETFPLFALHLYHFTTWLLLPVLFLNFQPQFLFSCTQQCGLPLDEKKYSMESKLYIFSQTFKQPGFQQQCSPPVCFPLAANSSLAFWSQCVTSDLCLFSHYLSSFSAHCFKHVTLCGSTE